MCINTFRNKSVRVLACFLCIVLLGGMLQTVSADEAYSSYISLPPVQLDVKEPYFSYIQKHSTQARPGQPIVLQAVDYSHSDYQPQKTADTLQTKESGYVEWEVDVKAPGLYHIRLEYLATSGKSSSIIRSVKIDGELPFEDARSVEFNRIWVDKRDAQGNTIQEAPNGNQIRPEQEEIQQWQSAYIRDSVGYYTDPFRFYFSQGRHTFRLEAVRPLSFPFAVEGGQVQNLLAMTPHYWRISKEGADALAATQRLEDRASVVFYVYRKDDSHGTGDRIEV